MKMCAKCGETKPLDEFNVRKRSADGRQSYCRACSGANLRHMRYGVTADAYSERLAAQGGGCAICGGSNPDGRALFVDHDHACCPGERTCGKCVRGLLCNSCNHGIGLFADSADRLMSAAKYLEAHA